MSDQSSATSPVHDFNDRFKSINELVTERERQVLKEGFTLENDDSFQDGTLVLMAASYLLVLCKGGGWVANNIWPRKKLGLFKPGGYRKMLIKAGALVLAELERLEREARNKPEYKNAGR